MISKIVWPHICLLGLILIVSCNSNSDKSPEVVNSNTAYPMVTSVAKSAATAYPVYPEPTLAPTTTPLPEAERATRDLLARYGWTISKKISIYTEVLPTTFQHEPGDFPYVIYWAYNNEFSKKIGLDIAPYLGQTVHASLYQLNEPLPEAFRPYTTARAVILTLDGKIIGAWIDQGRHYGFACSLNRKQFEEIVGSGWSKWLVHSGFVDLPKEKQSKFAVMTPEEIIKVYYTALDTHDYQTANAVRSRRALTQDLFVNMFDDAALFNQQENASFTQWIANIKNAKLLNVTQVKDNHYSAVYAVEVNFQFVNPNFPTIPEGKNIQFIVVNKEIEELGWRIEDFNTSP